jgi:hypothetical protein
LLQETRGVVRDIPARIFGKQVAFSISTERPSSVGSIYRTAEADVRRAVEVMRDFLDDHSAVFARSHDHCCCCGKGLTDELSRSRGIGPECIKKIPYAAFKATPTNTIVAREAAPVADGHPPRLDRIDEYVREYGEYRPRFPSGSRVLGIRHRTVPKGEGTGRVIIEPIEKTGTVLGFRFNLSGPDRYHVRWDDGTEETEVSSSFLAPAITAPQSDDPDDTGPFRLIS